MHKWDLTPKPAQILSQTGLVRANGHCIGMGYEVESPSSLLVKLFPKALPRTCQYTIVSLRRPRSGGIYSARGDCGRACVPRRLGNVFTVRKGLWFSYGQSHVTCHMFFLSYLVCRSVSASTYCMLLCPAGLPIQAVNRCVLDCAVVIKGITPPPL